MGKYSSPIFHKSLYLNFITLYKLFSLSLIKPHVSTNPQHKFQSSIYPSHAHIPLSTKSLSIYFYGIFLVFNLFSCIYTIYPYITYYMNFHITQFSVNTHIYVYPCPHTKILYLYKFHTNITHTYIQMSYLCHFRISHKISKIHFYTRLIQSSRHIILY